MGHRTCCWDRDANESRYNDPSNPSGPPVYESTCQMCNTKNKWMHGGCIHTKFQHAHTLECKWYDVKNAPTVFWEGDKVEAFYKPTKKWYDAEIHCTPTFQGE